MRRLCIVTLTCLIGLPLCYLFVIQPFIRRELRDDWAQAVVEMVAEVAIRYLGDTGKTSVSFDELVAHEYLVTEALPNGTRIRQPSGGGITLGSEFRIQIHFPAETTGWRLQGRTLVNDRGEVAALPTIEIVGLKYKHDGLAERQNRRFAREWFECVTRGAENPRTPKGG